MGQEPRILTADWLLTRELCDALLASLRGIHQVDALGAQ
jgi:hypothetical protein